MISNALREKQQWLITPKPDTRTKLVEKLTEMFAAVLTGEWDRLEASEGLTVTRAQKLRSATQIARTVSTGLLPIGLFLLARRYGFIEIASPVADYLTAGPLLWTVISLGLAIDPTLTEKTSAMRDVLSVIPGLGKRGGKE